MTSRDFGRLAFRHQLALVLTLTSGLAVGFVALGVLGYEARQSYDDLRNEFLPLARIIGANSVGALAFGDAPTARETLAALALKPNVVSARLYGPSGAPFATYHRAGAETDPIPEEPGAPGHRFEARHMLVVESIVHDGDRLGTLYVKIDMRQSLTRFSRTLLVLGVCFFAATGLALLLSVGLQRRVSQPVLELGQAAEAITQGRDYSIRVAPSGPRELRALTLAFNEMLSQIQERDGALRAARDGLELRVAERLRELEHETAERRKAEVESELRAQRLQLLGAALESATDAVAITDHRLVIQWVNPSFCTLMGYSAAEALGCNVNAFRSGRAEDEGTYENLWDTVRAGQVWDGEAVGRRKDASLCLVGQTVMPVRDAAGRIASYVAVMRDVSQRRRLEAELRQAQKMEAVGRLSGGVAHDFNNILNVILGFGELLLKKLPAEDPLRRYSHEILKAAKRGASLTRQLLAFSRQQVLQPKVVDLNATIVDMEKMLSRLIGEDVELVSSLEPELGRVEVDPGQIEQVLMNLVVNARDAMPEGGTLTVETANVVLTEADAARHDSEAAPGPYVRMLVSDTGTGMDQATLSHMFEPFFTTKAVDRGTGLGLATVYGIVKQSRGYVSVRSALGHGTTFTILLPRISGERAGYQQCDEDAVAPAGRGTVLLVEDDDAARALWRELLEMLGYETLVAANGIDAIERASGYAGRIDVLLSDVVMPRLGGRELASRLREARPELRVVFMSGYTTDTVLRQGIAANEGAFLQKPFSARELAEKVRSALVATPA